MDRRQFYATRRLAQFLESLQRQRQMHHRVVLPVARIGPVRRQIFDVGHHLLA